MRLQTESRRQTAAAPPPSALDLSRAGISGFGNPPSSKRASFTPLTGRQNGHRRISSISGDGQGLGVLQQQDLNPSPNGQLAFYDPSTTNLGPPSSRRSLFKSSPPLQDVPLPSPNVPSPELEALKKEVQSLKRELSDTRMELAEASEAKEASETCVKALRDFIAETQVGLGTSGGESSSIKLPPPPTATNGDELDSDYNRPTASASTSGWGFKLWKGDNTPKSPSVNTAVASSPPLSSPSLLTSQQTPTASASFSRIGSFFSSRASVSSTAPSCNAPPRSSSYRDSMSGLSISDTSSVIEPLSPAPEPQGNVKVTVVPEAGEEGVDGTLGTSLAKEQDGAIVAQHSATVVG